MNKLKIVHANYKSWELHELYIPKEGKNAGQHIWKFYKHPGSLRSLANALLDHHVGEFNSDDILLLMEKIDSAVKTITEELEGMIENQ